MATCGGSLVIAESKKRRRCLCANESVSLTRTVAGGCGVYRESAGEEYSAQCADPSADRYTNAVERAEAVPVTELAKNRWKGVAARKYRLADCMYGVTAVSRRRGLACQVCLLTGPSGLGAWRPGRL